MFTKALITGFAIAIASTAATQVTAGTTCKDVHIEAHNETGKQVKVIDMYYKTYDARGRVVETGNEVIKNSEVPKGKSYTTTRNLEDANGLSTRVWIEYRVRKKHSGWDQWTGVQSAFSDRVNCERYASFEVELD